MMPTGAAALLALAFGVRLVAVFALGFAAVVDFLGAAAFLAGLGAAAFALGAAFALVGLGLTSFVSLTSFSFCVHLLAGHDNDEHLWADLWGYRLLLHCGLCFLLRELHGTRWTCREGGLADEASCVVAATAPAPKREPRSGRPPRIDDAPFGCWKSPFSTPDFKALLNRESNWVSEGTLMLLLALTYFLIACRLVDASAPHQLIRPRHSVDDRVR